MHNTTPENKKREEEKKIPHSNQNILAATQTTTKVVPRVQIL